MPRFGNQHDEDPELGQRDHDPDTHSFEKF
jgi:hypothetical protein